MSINKRTIAWITGVLLVMTVLAVGAAGAESLEPGVFFQGMLTNPTTGQPYNGTYTIRFNLYESETAPTHVWRNADSGEVMTVNNGVVTTTIGSGEVFNGRKLWLGIEILEYSQGWPPTPYWRELLPRLELRPTAYANSLVPGASLHSFHAQEFSLIRPPNPRQLALLRWWEGNEAPIRFALDDAQGAGADPAIPTWGIAFDGNNMWTTRPFEAGFPAVVGALNRTAASDGNCWGVEHSAGGVVNWCDMVIADPTGAIVPQLLNDPRGVIYDGRYVWIANYLGNDVTRVEARTAPVAILAPLNAQNFLVGTAPTNLAFDGKDIWVINTGSNNVTRLGASNGNLVNTYSLPGQPRDLAFDGTYVWITHSGVGTDPLALTRIRIADGQSESFQRSVVGENPWDITYDGINIWVANQNTGSPSVTKIRASDGTRIATYNPGLCCPGDLLFDGYNIWVINRPVGGCGGNEYTVVKIRAYDGSFVGMYPVGTGNTAQNLGFDGENVWVTISNANNTVSLVKL